MAASSQPVTKPCSPGSAILRLLVVLNPYSGLSMQAGLAHCARGGSGEMAPWDNPKRGLGICPVSLEGEWELSFTAEPDTAAFPSPVLVAVTPVRGPIPLET